MLQIRKLNGTSLFNVLPENTLLKNVRAFDPEQKLDQKVNIIICKGTIDKITDKEPASFSGTIIDGKGALLMPGFFDMHVHLREPGREDEETILSGSMAAANGGITGVACMPNTDPAIDNQEVVKYIREQAQDFLTDIHPIAALTRNREGKELSPIAELVDAGAVAISDDGSSVMNAEVMRRALEYSKMFDIPVLGHEEENNLCYHRHMHEGFVSTRLGIPGMPGIGEDIMVARDIILAEYTGGRFHICHISTGKSVELVRQAKAKGLSVTCEVTPHHFTLTDQKIEVFDTNAKMNPPLRSEEDRQALLEGLKDGTIDVIATDHAPHAIEEKDVEFVAAPFGITGLETAVGLIFSELYHKNILSLNDIYLRCIATPRRILKLAVPAIKIGEKANFTLINPDQEWRYCDTTSYSKSQNTPFKERLLKGKAQSVINKNKIFSNQ
jgi:dihydroorotase